MIEKYKTLYEKAQAELVEKKSRFIATAMPVEDEQQAQLFIDEIKKKYWDATHNVFAYQIGENNNIQRYSDDGEPSGTAGMPVLEVLKGENIKNSLVVVTRYFGGTLLGTGGLVRAYGHCAKQAILNSGIIEKVLYQQFEVTVDYTMSGKVQYEVLKNEFVIKDTIYTDKVTFIIMAETIKADMLKELLIEITSATALIEKGPLEYGVWLNGVLQ